MSKYIYLVLSSSSTVLAKLIRFSTKSDLNHASLSLDESLNNMYSFGRLTVWNPFHAGFVVEDKDTGFYSRFSDTHIQVYRLAVSEDVYESTKECLSYYQSESQRLGFNFVGLTLTKFSIPFPRKNKYFCSEFVALVIKDCSVRSIDRDPHTYRPYYFLELDDMELVYSGLICDYDASKLQVFELSA